jgi:hypothetical protein
MNPAREPGLLLLVCLLSLPARAGVDERRFTTLFDELVDGKPGQRSTAENAVIGALTQAGVPFIDEAQSRSIRSLTDAGAIMEGGISQVITSMDADVILAGVCHVSKLESELLGGSAHRYDAEIEAKLIMVDTGAVLGTFSVQAGAMGFSVRQAAAKAARKAGAELAKQVLARLSTVTASRRLELIIAGSPNVSALEKIAQGLRRVPGVAKVRVLRARRGQSKLAIESDGAEARELAVALDEEAALGLEVYGYSATALHAAWAPDRALQVPVVIGALTEEGGARRGMGGVLAGVMGVALANVGFVSLPLGTDARRLGQTVKARRKALLGEDVDPKAALVLTGTARREGERLHLAVTLETGQQGAALLTRQKSCPRDEAAGCAAGLGDELAAALPEAVLKKRHLFSKDLGKALKARGEAVRPLEILAVAVEDLFPVDARRYASEAIGSVTLKNRGDAALANLRVQARLAGFTRAETEVSHAALAPGEAATVPVKLALDPEALARHEGTVPAVLELSVTYEVDEISLRERRTRALVVHDRSALSWDSPETLAAFVTARDEAVVALARAAVTAVPAEQAGRPLATLIAVFEAMKLSGVRYVSDPSAPFGQEAIDFVQAPARTLSAKSGDCDDLAVLYAALMESVGVAARLLVTPDHVFVAVHAGLPVQAAYRVTMDEGKAWRDQADLWLPVETTALGGSFLAAWDKGAAELARWRERPDALTVITVREAWARHPPGARPSTSLGTGGAQGAPEPRGMSRLAEAVPAALAVAWAEQTRRLEAALTALPTEDLAGRARVLVALDRATEAVALFEGVSQDASSPQTLNNLGNAYMLAARQEAALKVYERALEAAADNAYIHGNAALAALALGKDDQATEHIADCLMLDAVDVVEALAGLESVAGEGARASGEADRGRRALGDVIHRAYAKAGKPRPEPKKAKARARAAGGDPAAQLSLHLFWL